MSGKPPGSEVTLTVLWGELPPEGDLLRTAAGSCYQVLEARRSRPGSKRVGVLRCMKLENGAVELGQPGVWSWRFAGR